MGGMVKENPDPRVWPETIHTKQTAPGFRRLDSLAVRIGFDNITGSRILRACEC